MKWHIDKTKLFWYNKLVRHIHFGLHGIRYEVYYLNCKLHRTDGPAVNVTYVNGVIVREEYYLNGKRHRTDGPAVINKHVNGVIAREEYYLNGKCHNTNGPAYRTWDKNGCAVSAGYYLNDRYYTKERFNAILSK